MRWAICICFCVTGASIVWAEDANQAASPGLEKLSPELKTEISYLITKEACRKIADKKNCPSDTYPQVCSALSSDNQQAIRAINEQCDEVLKEVSLVSKLTESVYKYSDQINSAILAGLLALLAWLRLSFTKLKKSAQAAFERLSDPACETNQNYESKSLNIFLVGEGGSGKTSIIKSLTAAPEAAPDIATNSISTYSLVHEVTVLNKERNIKSRRFYRFYIDDYEGQNLPELMGDSALKERYKKIPDAIPVIVVDLFEGGGNSTSKVFCEERINYQLSIYNDVVIQFILKHTPKSEDTIIFINKLDMLQTIRSSSYTQAIEKYDDLIKKFKEVRGRRLHVIVGSARSGLGVAGDSEGNAKNRGLLETLHDVCK